MSDYDFYMSSKKIFPAKLEGTVRVPGDKSISQRVAMLASLAEGAALNGYTRPIVEIEDCLVIQDGRQTIFPEA